MNKMNKELSTFYNEINEDFDILEIPVKENILKICKCYSWYRVFWNGVLIITKLTRNDVLDIAKSTLK